MALVGDRCRNKLAIWAGGATDSVTDVFVVRIGRSIVGAFTTNIQTKGSALEAAWRAGLTYISGCIPVEFDGTVGQTLIGIEEEIDSCIGQSTGDAGVGGIS